MKTKHIITITAFMLFTLASFVAKAQDKQVKYEYAVVKLRGITKIAVCTSANSNAQLFDVGKDDYDIAVIKKVEEMNQQGWEVYNTTSVSTDGNIYFLRKKKE